MPRLEVLILLFGERHWDSFVGVTNYQRSPTRTRVLQHDFLAERLQRTTLPSETLASLLVIEHHEAMVDVRFIPNALGYIWKHGGFYMLRFQELSAPEHTFAPVPTEIRARSFRSSSALLLTLKPQELEPTLALFKRDGSLATQQLT